MSNSELLAKVTEFVRQEFERTRPTNQRGQIIPVTRGMVSNVLLALAGQCLIESNVEQPVWVSGRERDAEPFFVFKNGMVGIQGLVADRSTRLRPHCANWFTQTTFPYDFDPAASCQRWLAFLDEVLEGDAERIALVQQWFGYCLTSDTKQQRFVVAIGEGQNGKSVVLDLLTAMLGPENVSHVPVEVFSQRFQLTMTLGKLANISYDTGRVDEPAEAAIKQFTGGDRMYFDRKGVPGVFAYPSARLILATNQEPRFADRTKGVWRRMIVIPFRVSIPKERQDPQLAEKLKVELPGIFNWAVEGLRDLRRAGLFPVPGVCEEAWQEFRRDSNPAAEFIQQCYEVGTTEDAVICSEMYAAYKDWCAMQEFKPMDATSFGKEVRRTIGDGLQRARESSGERRWYYRGLRRTSVAVQEAAAMPA